MEQPPQTRYASSGELETGYQVLGDGPIDVVFVPGLISNIDSLWGLPAAARFLRRLSSFSRLVIYDKRGQGVSDRSPTVPTLEDDMADLVAILDAVGSERTSLFAFSEGGPMSALFAATYPDRVRGLVLCGSYASGESMLELHRARGDDVVAGMEEIVAHWGEGRGLAMFAPSIASEERARRFGAFERSVGSRNDVRSRWETAVAVDVTPVLSALNVPTLVLHRAGDRAVPAAAGREMAAAIPGSRYVEFEGDDHIPWVGDADAVLDEAQEFLTGARAAAEVDRALATVMFTDIVNSTGRAAELGDRAWRSLLEAHDELVREQLASHGGRAVKTVGDGFLATFDGPARGIHCARSIVDSVPSLGVEVRAGLHTGECELIGDDVGGIAVHIGARVGAFAAGGEVLVSRTVRDLVVGSGIEFEARGAHQLKGVPGDWELFAVAVG